MNIQELDRRIKCLLKQNEIETDIEITCRFLKKKLIYSIYMYINEKLTVGYNYEYPPLFDDIDKLEEAFGKDLIDTKEIFKFKGKNFRLIYLKYNIDEGFISVNKTATYLEDESRVNLTIEVEDKTTYSKDLIKKLFIVDKMSNTLAAFRVINRIRVFDTNTKYLFKSTGDSIEKIRVGGRTLYKIFRYRYGKLESLFIVDENMNKVEHPEKVLFLSDIERRLHYN